MHVLIVDDSPTALLHSQLSLEDAAARHGIVLDIRTAADGESALESVPERMPELVILDVVLPGISGFEVCRRLKAFSAAPRVAYVSGSLDAALLDEARASGADYFIRKPIDAGSFDGILGE